MTDEIKRICVTNSAYTLLLYFLICGYSENDIFIVSNGIPKEILKNINHIKYPYFSYFPYNPHSNVLMKIFQIPFTVLRQAINIIKLRFLIYIKTRNKEVYVYGHGHQKFSYPLYEFENSYIIEDGMINYINLAKPYYFKKSYLRLLHFFGFYTRYLNEGFGTHDNIKKIFLTKDNVPEIIKNKTEIINIQELWDSKSKQEQNKILEIFNIDNLTENIGKNIVLFVTQPLSEDKLISFEEEIDIYKYLLEKQAQTDDIFIKKHPRETKDYNIIFPNLKIIDKQFPLEIFKCLGIKIKKIVTVSSTVALNFSEDCEIEFYDKKTSSMDVNNSIDYLKKEL